MLTERVESWRDAGGFEEVARPAAVRAAARGRGRRCCCSCTASRRAPTTGASCSSCARPAPRSPSTSSASASPRSRADHVYTLAWQADAAEELVRRARLAAGLRRRPRHGHLGRDRADGARPRAASSTSTSPGRCSSTAACCSHLAKPTLGQKLLRSRLGPLFARLTTRARLPRPVRARLLRRAPAERRGGGRPVVADRPQRRRTASATCSSTTWPSANASPSAGTARSATGPGRSPSPGACRTRSPRPRSSTACASCARASPVIELPELAHYPQIEAPRQIAAALDRALSTAGFPVR